MDLQTVLQVLSGTAIVTTICLFFCGIPICLTIKRRMSTKDISGLPFIMGLLGGSFWLRYGLLKNDFTMITVNVVSVSFFTVYCFFYLYYAKPKTFFAVELGVVFTLVFAMVAWIAYRPDVDYLGILCMTFNIINFGAPLAGLGVVLRERNCSTLPLPLCVANFAVSSQWLLYGRLVGDPYVMAPNGIGMSLAIVQLSLFIVFPINENGRSPLERVAAWFTGHEIVVDIEKGPIPSSLSSACLAYSGKPRSESFSVGSPPSYRSRSNSLPTCSSMLSV